jgi:hypothetical protein
MARWACAVVSTRAEWTKNCTQLNKKYPHGLGKDLSLVGSEVDDAVRRRAVVALVVDRKGLDPSG